MLKFIISIARLTAGFALLLCAPAAGAAPAADSGEMLPDALLYPGDRPGHILVVDKINQMLYLYRHDGAGRITLEKVMPCSTGENLGDKMVEGDRKTPNGFYLFNQKLLPRELSPIYGTLAYPTDYPNFWDRRLGRGGYGIWLHGINKPLTDYDSNGCIELENADIAHLEDLLELFRTPLITYESLSLAPVAELEREARELRAFLEDWRRAWSEEDHAAYRAKYAPEFVNSDGRSFEGWMTHKENVAKNYNKISVELKDLRIYRHRDVVAAAFVQDYRGDGKFASVGLKRLYIRKEGGAHLIVGEEFKPRPSFDANKKLSAEEKRLALATPPLAATPATAEPEGSRAAVEARAAAEDRAASGNLAEDSAAAGEDAPLETDPAAAAEAAQAAQAEAEARAAAETRAQEALLAGVVKKWAEAWSAREVEAYFAFYHPDFRYKAKNMDLASFKRYREELMSAAGVIEVNVSDFEVQVKGDLARAIFRQDYRSDQLRDRGRKTLIFKKIGLNWQILSETWQAE